MSTATATIAATAAIAAATAAAFQKGTMTKKDHAALKKELFDQDVKSFQASLVKMSPRAFNAQKLDLNARLEQNIAAYAECKAMLDNLMKAVKPLKTKMTKAGRVVKTLTAYKKTWTNERKLRPKTFHKVSGRAVFMGHFIKNLKKKADAKLDPKAFMTEASAAWAALTDDKKAHWKSKAEDKNNEKETARTKAALLAQVDALAPLGSDSDSDESAVAPLDNNDDSDADDDEDDAAAELDEAAETQIAMALANDDTDDEAAK